MALKIVISYLIQIIDLNDKTSKFKPRSYIVKSFHYVIIWNQKQHLLNNFIWFSIYMYIHEMQVGMMEQPR